MGRKRSMCQCRLSRFAITEDSFRAQCHSRNP